MSKIRTHTLRTRYEQLQSNNVFSSGSSPVKVMSSHRISTNNVNVKTLRSGGIKDTKTSVVKTDI